jgi:hypothetical protein
LLGPPQIHPRVQYPPRPRPQPPQPYLAADGNLNDRVAQRPWTAKQFPDVAAWVKANARAAELTTQASRLARYYSPYLSPKGDGTKPGTMMEMLLPVTQRARGLGQLLIIRAMQQIGEGDLDGAREDLLACHRLGRLVAQGATLIEYLVGVALDIIACQCDVAFLADPRLSAATLARFKAELDALGPFPGLADKVDSGERLTTLDVMQMTARHGLAYLEKMGAPLGADEEPGVSVARANVLFADLAWDPAFKDCNAWYDRGVAALRIGERAGREAALQAMETDLTETRTGLAKRMARVVLEKQADKKGRAKLLGDLHCVLFFPAVRKVQQAADQREQTHRNLQVAVALAAHRLAHKQFPTKLSELSPRFIKSIPFDVFSGNELVYRAIDDGYLLYSVGVNGRDDQGRTRNESDDCDDLTVRVPVPEMKLPGK